jgi:hypothetical protein
MAGKYKDAPVTTKPTKAQERGAYRELIPSITRPAKKLTRAKGDE